MCNIIKKQTVKSQIKVVNNEISCILNAFKMLILLIKLKEYKDVFLVKNVNKLSLHKDYNHAIKIIEKSLYNLLYNLFNIELMTLR